MEAIKRELGGRDSWKSRLSSGRREKIDEEVARAKREDVFVEELLFTQSLSNKFTQFCKAFST